MFKFFIAQADKVGEKILNGAPGVGVLDRLLWNIGDVLVYGPLKNRFGLSSIKVGYTAGEAIGPEIFRFYRSIGVNLKQLYGQTEASVYVTMQPDGEIRADTVGRPAPQVEIRIAENGEVLYRSPGVFLGYYKDEAKTAETKTADGFVHSGDAGFFDENGHLKIIDRAKDVGRMRDGALFPPKYVENKLKFYPNIKEAVAFGDGRDYVACFLNIDLVAVGNWAERQRRHLRLLPGTRRPSPRLRHDREACRRGEPLAGRRAAHGRRRRSGASSSCTRSSTPTTAN